MAADVTTADSVPTDVATLARELGEAIAEMPAYESFLEARADVADDPDLQERIEAFERQRDEFLQARQSGEATQENVRELQRAQRELHANPTMAAYLEAQERLQDRLAAVDTEISAPLEIQFGDEAGGCCQD